MQNAEAYIKTCYQVLPCGVKNRVSHLTFHVDFLVTSEFADCTFVLFNPYKHCKYGMWFVAAVHDLAVLFIGHRVTWIRP